MQKVPQQWTRVKRPGSGPTGFFHSAQAAPNPACKAPVQPRTGLRVGAVLTLSLTLDSLPGESPAGAFCVAALPPKVLWAFIHLMFHAALMTLWCR